MDELLSYRAFTDIEFNPDKSFNCRPDLAHCWSRSITSVNWERLRIPLPSSSCSANPGTALRPERRGSDAVLNGRALPGSWDGRLGHLFVGAAARDERVASVAFSRQMNVGGNRDNNTEPVQK